MCDGVHAYTHGTLATLIRKSRYKVLDFGAVLILASSGIAVQSLDLKGLKKKKKKWQGEERKKEKETGNQASNTIFFFCLFVYPSIWCELSDIRPAHQTEEVYRPDSPLRTWTSWVSYKVGTTRKQNKTKQNKNIWVSQKWTSLAGVLLRQGNFLFRSMWESVRETEEVFDYYFGSNGWQCGCIQHGHNYTKEGARRWKGVSGVRE